MSVNDLISFESGTMSLREQVELFSELVKSGVVWKLQGCYGRIAKSFINKNIISEDGEIICYPED